MTEIYGHRWTSAYGAGPDDPESSAAATWAKGLVDVSTKQIAAGLQASITAADSWPPTLPEFRARCLGIPTLAMVKLELRSPHTRSLFTHLVWQYVDSTAYGAANGDKAERILRDAYDLAREHAMRGGTLPSVATGIVAGPDKQKWEPPPPEKIRQTLERTRAEVGIREGEADQEPRHDVEEDTVG